MSRSTDGPRGAVQEAKVHRVELIISNILRAGVSISLALLVLGTTITFIRHPEYRNSPAALHRLTTPGAAFPETLGEVAKGLVDGQGRAVVLLGLLVLIATPVVRVAVSVFAFIYQRDRTFVVLTLIVLALLLLSFALGKVE